MQKVIFSGIKPSGDFHLGNYLGAVKNWVEGQSEENTDIFCIVDLHAITVEQDPIELKKRTLDIAAFLIACGIDPEKSILFLQSQNLDHANLAWIMNCNVGFGHLGRMTQFKDKHAKGENVTSGMFTYPALMAADILLYDTTDVPVGDDQKQHVELTRDIAQSFNSKYGDTFVLPEPVISAEGARIMSLTNPENKMSKSDDDVNGCIYLLDEEDVIRKKIMSATTDSENAIKRPAYAEASAGKGEKAGIANLLTIYSLLSDISIEELEEKYKDSGYGDFKKDLAEVVVNALRPIREKFNEIRNGNLEEILHKGAEKTKEISNKKLSEVYDKVGFVN